MSRTSAGRDMAPYPTYIEYIIAQIEALEEMLDDCGILSYKMQSNMNKIKSELKEIEGPKNEIK